MGNRFYRPISKSSTVLLAWFFALIFGAMGIGAIVTVTRERNLTAELDSRGVRTSGVVIDHIDYTGKNRYLVVKYEANGSETSQMLPVTSSDYFRLANGDSTHVEYLKEDPTKAKIEGSKFIKTPSYFIVVGAVCILIAVTLAFGSIIWARTSPMEDL